MSRGAAITLIIGLVLVGGLVWALGNNEPEDTVPTPTPTPTEVEDRDDGEDAATDDTDDDAAATTSVSIVSSADDGFSPGTIRVKVGDTVTWTNNDSMPHTVEFSDEESDTLNEGDTYTKTFDTAGSFSYICGLHPNMRGMVIVEQ
jgi:plastocyanin